MTLSFSRGGGSLSGSSSECIGTASSVLFHSDECGLWLPVPEICQKVNRSNAKEVHTGAIENVPASKQHLAPKAKGEEAGGEVSVRYGK